MRYFFTLLCLILMPYSHAQNCPEIEAIMVDACGNEPLNEFVIISSGDGFLVDDLQFGFNPTNTGGGASNANINDGFISCGLTEGNPDVYTGCNNIIPVGPGDFIPEDAYLILQSSNGADADYDFSDLCEDDACIYVVANSCTRTFGAFTNKDTDNPGPRNNTLAISGTSCQDVATFNTQDLISNADGNYFIPPSTYGISSPDPCVAPPIPPAQGTLPVFDDFEPICTGDESPLPNVSTNGVEGEWIPEFNNQQTTTYTFVPDEDTCGPDIEVTIEVVPNEAPSFSFETDFCLNDQEFPDLPSTSDNSIEGEWSPAEIDPEIENYTFLPFSDCAEETSISLNFEDEITPQFNLPSQVCQGEIIEFPLVSENEISGTWEPDFDPNQSATYTFTPEEEFCAEEVSFFIEISENDATQIEDLIPEDLSIECDEDLPEPPNFNLEELCGVGDIVFSESINDEECPVLQQVIRTWTVFDTNGEEVATFEQEILLEDTTPPVFTSVPENQIFSCEADWPDNAEIEAIDNCSEVSIEIVEEIIDDPNCTQNFTLIRNFTAIDECGNEANAEQVIEFIDDEGPVFEEGLPSEINVVCGEVPDPVTPEVIDECGEVAELNFTEEVLDDCSNGKITERTWEATDNCGNTSFYTLQIIEDCGPIVYEGISPNNDGINDFLTIDNIECFPENKLQIFNRYGKQVFQTSNYNNSSNVFEGLDQSGNPLVTGTYFYVFNFTNLATNQQKTKKGWIYVNVPNN